jgi:hypothetical protein
MGFMVEWCRLIVNDTQILVDGFWVFGHFEHKSIISAKSISKFNLFFIFRRFKKRNAKTSGWVFENLVLNGAHNFFSKKNKSRSPGFF